MVQTVDKPGSLSKDVKQRVMTEPRRGWISLWFVLSSALVFWDAGYLLLR